MPALSVITGLIKRRLLLNYRADPAVVQRLLPGKLEPKIHAGHAIVGACLIRLEKIRPDGLPEFLGLSSENAAHRIAVTWDDETGPHEGVFIPRRDTGSMLNAVAGGRLFPGAPRAARFTITEGLREIDFRLRSRDGLADLHVVARQSHEIPPTSSFRSLADASDFFEGGCLGYSSTSDPARFDGVRLEAQEWRVHALDVHRLHSAYFEDSDRFPKDSIQFDHGLIMRNILHRWHREPSLQAVPPAGG
jgi:hypothetical protein